MGAKVWKLGKGNWAGVSSTGKRYAGLASKAAAQAKVGLSKSSPRKSSRKGKKTGSKNKGGGGKKGGLMGLFNFGAIEALLVSVAGAFGLRRAGVKENAVPLTHVAYGTSGHLFSRRGKAYLVPGLIATAANTVLNILGV